MNTEALQRRKDRADMVLEKYLRQKTEETPTVDTMDGDLHLDPATLDSPAGQLASQIAAEIGNGDASALFDIGIIIEWITIIADMIGNCSPSAERIQRMASRQGLGRRRNRAWINLRTRQTHGAEVLTLLGGSAFGGHVLDVLAKPENLELIRGALETPPPVWSTFRD